MDDFQGFFTPLDVVALPTESQPLSQQQLRSYRHVLQQTQSHTAAVANRRIHATPLWFIIPRRASQLSVFRSAANVNHIIVRALHTHSVEDSLPEYPLFEYSSSCPILHLGVGSVLPSTTVVSSELLLARPFRPRENG